MSAGDNEWFRSDSSEEKANLRRIREVSGVRLTPEEREFPAYLKDLVLILKKCKAANLFHLISLDHLTYLLRYTESDVPAVTPLKVFNPAVYSYGDRCTNFHLKWQRQVYRSELVSSWLTAHVELGNLDRFETWDQLRTLADTESLCGLVAAQWIADRKWYRGYLMFIQEDNKAVVYYIDQGNVEVQGLNTLRRLPEELQRVLPMAFRCGLVDVSMKDDEEAILQGQAQLYFLSRLKGTSVVHCRIRVMENANSLVNSKAVVELKDQLGRSWKEGCSEDVSFAVREKMVWRNERVRLQDDVPMPSELELYEKFQLPVSQEIGERKLPNQPSAYRLIYALNPVVMYVREASTEIAEETERLNTELQEFYNFAQSEAKSRYKIRTSRVLRDRFYAWLDSRDGKWHRIKVVRTDMPPGKCFVFRIDHGDHIVVDIKNMMEMVPYFLKWVPCVVKAHLIHVKPAVGDYWWDTCGEDFEKLAGKEFPGVVMSHEDIQPRGSSLYGGMSYGLILINSDFRSGYSLQAELVITGKAVSEGFAAGNPHLAYLHHAYVPKYNRCEMISAVKHEFGLDLEQVFSNGEADSKPEDTGEDNHVEDGLTSSWTIFKGDPSIQPKYEGQGKREVLRCGCGRSCGEDCFSYWMNRRSRVGQERHTYRFLKRAKNIPGTTEADPTDIGPFTKKFEQYLGAVRISHAEGGGVFYIQHVSELSVLAEIMRDLGKVVADDQMRLKDDDIEGALVSALVHNENGDPQWHRAYVSKVLQQQRVAKVILYDFGEMINVSLDKIRDIPAYFVSIPPFCRRAHLDVPPRYLRNNMWTANLNANFTLFVSLHPKTVFFACKTKELGDNVVKLIDYGQSVTYDPKKRQWWSGGALSIDYPVVPPSESDHKLLYHLLNSIGINLCYESLDSREDSYVFEQVENDIQ